jgi:signal peptidase II
MTRNKYYLVTLLILIIDHLTKWIASATLAENVSVDIIPGYLCLSRVHNSGVAFGIFDKIDSVWKPYLLAAMAIVAVVVILIYSVHMPKERKLLQLALAITLGGILGNLADRIFRGYVVDFIEFHVHKTFYWPNFNVADSAITIGIALLLIDTVKNPAIEEVPEQPTTDNQS